MHQPAPIRIPHRHLAVALLSTAALLLGLLLGWPELAFAGFVSGILTLTLRRDILIATLLVGGAMMWTPSIFPFDIPNTVRLAGAILGAIAGVPVLLNVRVPLLSPPREREMDERASLWSFLIDVLFVATLYVGGLVMGWDVVALFGALLLILMLTFLKLHAVSLMFVAMTAVCTPWIVPFELTGPIVAAVAAVCLPAAVGLACLRTPERRLPGMPRAAA